MNIITIARYPSSSDTPIDIITTKQAQTAMQTLTETFLILEKLYVSY